MQKAHDIQKTYKYYTKSENQPHDTVEIDIIRHGGYVTTCVVDLHEYENGFRTFPCGNGDDMKLDIHDIKSIENILKQHK